MKSARASGELTSAPLIDAVWAPDKSADVSKLASLAVPRWFTVTPGSACSAVGAIPAGVPVLEVMFPARRDFLLPFRLRVDRLDLTSHRGPQQ
jgi:hypothetical protein